MISWPEKLVHDIARRRCVAFLGSGVSSRSEAADGTRPPLWKEFLTSSLERCEGTKAEINRMIAGGDYLTACQLIKARLGDARWHDLLEEKFLNPNYVSDKIHQAIFDLDLPIVATTNIDMIYDRFLNANYGAAAIVKKYHDEEIGRYIKSDAATRLVIKVHGSVDHLGKTVFTRQEYADARRGYSHFYRLLSALISTQTFVFLGYSLADPDINLLLEDYARDFKSPRPHYLLTADKASADMIDMFERNYSIRVLKYNAKDNHNELVESLEELARAAMAGRTAMSTTMAW